MSAGGATLSIAFLFILSVLALVFAGNLTRFFANQAEITGIIGLKAQWWSMRRYWAK